MKQMAIMKNVSFGCRDTNFAGLWFSAYSEENYAALQYVPAQQAIELIEKHNISDIERLEGKPCWVSTEDGIMRFLDFAKI